MTTFTTAVSLTENQAKQLIATLYPVHHNCNGDRESISADRLKKLSDELFLLLTLPIGSEVVMSVRRNTRPGAPGSTTFHFKHEFRVVMLTVYRDETSTPLDIARAFVHCINFGHFKHSVLDRWNYSLGKP